MAVRAAPLTKVAAPHGRRRSPPNSRLGGAALTLAALALFALGGPASAAAPPAGDWWTGLPRLGVPRAELSSSGRDAAGASRAGAGGALAGVARRPRWHDAFDLGATLRASSASAALGADLTLRVRLDAPEYLQRSRDEHDDLVEIAAALEREHLINEQLDWFARRCEGMWRAWQAQLVRSVLPAHPSAGTEPLELAHLRTLERLFAVAASHPASRHDILECRLERLMNGLRLASDHPRLNITAAEWRLRERTTAMMNAPSPPSLWLHTGLEANEHGSGASIRIGLDLPLPATGSDLVLSLNSDRAGVEGTLRWYRSGAEPRGGPVPRLAPDEVSESRLRAGLAAELRQRLLEAELARAEAELTWQGACPGLVPPDLEDCLQANPWELDRLHALLRAVDAELSAIRASLAALAASGHLLDELPSAR